MPVGEQPGDQEDLTGKPFVGPAGKVLDEALEKAGIDRKDVYVTNAVEHSSWGPRGKRRVHKTPAQHEVAACLDWLLGAIRLIGPRLIEPTLGRLSIYSYADQRSHVHDHDTRLVARDGALEGALA
jgi:uracil-DNA glycosylase